MRIKSDMNFKYFGKRESIVWTPMTPSRRHYPRLTWAEFKRELFIEASRFGFRSIQERRWRHKKLGVTVNGYPLAVGEFGGMSFAIFGPEQLHLFDSDCVVGAFTPPDSWPKKPV